MNNQHKNITKKEAIAKFRRMWRRMGELKISKEEYFRQLNVYPYKLKGNCYLCDYMFNSDSDCCLVDWSPAQDCMTERDEPPSLYRQWQDAYRLNNRDEMGRLALLISELPESKNEKL